MERHNDVYICSGCKILESTICLPQNIPLANHSPSCLCADDCSFLNAEACRCPDSKQIPSARINPLDAVHLQHLPAQSFAATLYSYLLEI